MKRRAYESNEVKVTDNATRTFFCDSLTDNAANGFVEPEHVQENSADLGKVEAAYRRASRDVRLENVR